MPGRRTFLIGGGCTAFIKVGRVNVIQNARCLTETQPRGTRNTEDVTGFTTYGLLTYTILRDLHT